MRKNPWDSGRNVDVTVFDCEDSSLNDISDGFAHIRTQCAEIDVVEKKRCFSVSLLQNFSGIVGNC